MIEYSGKLSIEAATAIAQANYNQKTQEEIITLKQRIAELEADKAILQKDIAFLQSCVNSGERASISDRPSQQPDSGEQENGH